VAQLHHAWIFTGAAATPSASPIRVSALGKRCFRRCAGAMVVVMPSEIIPATNVLGFHQDIR
jgi:hypothetical protein